MVDTIFGHTIGTAAFQFGDRTKWIFWHSRQCLPDDMEAGLCLPFADNLRDDSSVLFTLGTLITTMFFLPLALNDLKDNAVWQILAAFILLVSACQFIIQFAGMIDSQYLSVSSDDSLYVEAGVRGDSNEFWWGHKWENLFGVVLFNYSLVIAVPAWLYERDPHVDVPTVIYGSSFLSTFLYISIGCMGRLAMPHVSSNMLASLMSGAHGLLIQFSASVFAFFIIGLGIPLLSVWARLNLIAPSGEDQQPLCSRCIGNTLAVYFPFGVSWFLYNGKVVTKLLSLGGVFFTSFVAFLLPLSLALYVVTNSSAPGSVAVYGGISLTSRPAQELAVLGLLILAITAVIAAIAGDVVADVVADP